MSLEANDGANFYATDGNLFDVMQKSKIIYDNIHIEDNCLDEDIDKV